MFITVAVCTWNRSKLLRSTLEQILCLDIPDSIDWELIVVNNNSSDDTEEVIASFSDRLPIRQVFQPLPGLSHARNAAIAVARGDYMIWTDDDVLVNKEWLSAYVAAFRRWPGAAVFGGPIVPWFEGRPPSWLVDGWRGISNAFAIRDLGRETIRLDMRSGKLPFGANYAVKTDVQKQFPYDPAFGRRAGSMVSGEETRVMEQIFAGGATGWWVPDAGVLHWIPKSRQCINYLRSYYKGYGQTLALTEDLGAAKSFFGKPRWLLRRAVSLELRYRFTRYLCPTVTWLNYLADASICWGKLSGLKGRKS